MNALSRHLAANRANWDARAGVHATSPFYDVAQYVRDRDAISSVVEWDRAFFGSLAGLDVLHLQCHIGTDSISLARLGANVTAVDFSPKSLAIGRELAAEADTPVRFVCADVRSVDRLLRQRFDLVYASVGVLCWIPSFAEWARAAASCVRSGGRLYLRDGHPIKDTIDHQRDDEQVVCVEDYFAEGIAVKDDSGYTYTGDEARLTSPVNYQWLHTMGTIVSAVAAAGLTVERLVELDWLDWQAFPWMVRDEDGRWRFPEGHPRVPLAFSLSARAR